jgi:trigger factor
MVGSGRLSDGVRAGRIYLSRARREDETLKVTSETIAPREVELTVVPEERAVEQAMRRAAREASRQQPIPGFRPGRAPYTLVERRLGRDNILLQALQNIGRDLYSRAIKESGLDPFETTQFSISSEDPVELKLRVPLKPVVNLGDYAALHVDPEPEVVVTDEQVDEQLASLQRSHAENEPVERPVQMGDSSWAP